MHDPVRAAAEEIFAADVALTDTDAVTATGRTARALHRSRPRIGAAAPQSTVLPSASRCDRFCCRASWSWSSRVTMRHAASMAVP